MFKLFVLFSLSTLLMTSGAGAGPVQGTYIASGAGLNYAPALTADQNTDKVTTDPGGIGVGTLGWAFGNGFRIEAEGSYGWNSITSISTRRANGAIEPISSSSGRLSNYSAMANLAYDLPISVFHLPIQPYVGLGLGYTWLTFNGANGQEPGSFNVLETTYVTIPTFGTKQFITVPVIKNVNVTLPATVRLSATRSFAYQAFGGFSVPIAAVPGLDLTIEDRVEGAALANEKTVVTALNVVNGVFPSFSRTSGYHPINNAVLVGLRYTFATK